MSAIEMRNEIKKLYGKHSHEYNYFQWVFSRRPTEHLREVYKRMIEEYED